MAELDIDDIQRRMDASLASLHTEFMGLRAGRASTGMLEPIMVDAYGSKMPMNQVGNISAPEPRLLTVSVWDAGMASAVERRSANLTSASTRQQKVILSGCRFLICRKSAAKIW